MKPLAIDLYCGLGGWAEGFLSEGYRVIGFDVERHDYGTGGYPGELVLRDVLTLRGSEFVDASVIVASPPCQQYSYRAMPWSRARSLPPPDNSLFEACFRIQREANWAICDCECCRCKSERPFDPQARVVTGGHCARCNSFTNTGKYPRHIPLIVENVRGAQRWVGYARWHFGSYFLWGDVPALMPIARSQKVHGQSWSRFNETGQVTPHWRLEGLKQAKRLYWFDRGAALFGSDSVKRKAASAMLAKIPFPLAQHIARCFKQSQEVAA